MIDKSRGFFCVMIAVRDMSLVASSQSIFVNLLVKTSGLPEARRYFNLCPAGPITAARGTWRDLQVKEDFSWLPVKINTVTSPKAEAENVCQGKTSIWQNSLSHATVTENCCASSCKGNAAIHTSRQPFSILTSRRQMLREVCPARLLWGFFRGISSSLHLSGEQQNHGEYTGKGSS